MKTTLIIWGCWQKSFKQHLFGLLRCTVQICLHIRLWRMQTYLYIAQSPAAIGQKNLFLAFIDYLKDLVFYPSAPTTNNTTQEYKYLLQKELLPNVYKCKRHKIIWYQCLQTRLSSNRSWHLSKIQWQYYVQSHLHAAGYDMQLQ